jgi:thiol-disulfide isomerase/thioredoxin
MKTGMCVRLARLVVIAACAGMVGAGVARPASLEIDPAVLAGLEFPVPEEQSERAYLGVGPGKTFSVSDVKTSVLIIEVFSMYCPYCQAHAPTMNELHGLIQGNPKLKGKVKILGVGIQNTPYEVDVFRDKYQVPFALVSDEDMQLQQVTSKRFRTPTFIVLSNEEHGEPRVPLTYEGTFDDARKFLQSVLESTG